MGVDILGRTLLSHHKQEASFIYVNNVGPWKYDLGYHGAEGPAWACTGPYNNTQSCPYYFD